MPTPKPSLERKGVKNSELRRKWFTENRVTVLQSCHGFMTRNNENYASKIMT